MAREPDHAWEALVRETHANPAMERGALNVALKAIREACFMDGLHPDGIAEEIKLRAAAYRQTFPGLTLTPTALAKHWRRVLANQTPSLSAEEMALDRMRREHSDAQG